MLRDIQAGTGGFPEFVSLPLVHMGAPLLLLLQGRLRKEPTCVEALKLHAAERLALHGFIENVQVSG